MSSSKARDLPSKRIGELAAQIHKEEGDFDFPNPTLVHVVEAIISYLDEQETK